MDWTMGIFIGFVIVYGVTIVITLALWGIIGKIQEARAELTMHNTIYVFILFASISTVATAVCNITSLLGLSLIVTTSEILNENYSFPITLTSLSLFGFSMRRCFSLRWFFSKEMSFDLSWTQEKPT